MHTWVHRSVEPDGLGAVSDVLAELVVERSAMATEAAPDLQAEFARRDIGPVTMLSHDDFKATSRHARAIVRTGECTPYANVALYAGVAF